MNYFVLNKQLDYRRGVAQDCRWNNGRLDLQPGKGQGAFFSRIYDSHQSQTRWHRFVLRAQGPGRASLRFTFYVSDKLEVFLEGKPYVLPEFLAEPGISLEEKKRQLKSLAKKEVLFPKDILLHDLEGRYLFFLAELFAQDGKSPCITEMVLYFPMEDWLKFLPGVYARKSSGADFLSRYLGIFQSIYEEMEENIRTSSLLLDVQASDNEGLGQIAQWFLFNNLYLWPEEQLRKLLGEMQKVLARMGTVEGMLEILALYTGERPILIECGMVKGKQAERLYGNNPYTCILLIREHYLSTARDYEALMCLVEQMKPAHIQVRMIPLKPRIVLGAYTYLGINSELQGFLPVKLDGRSSLTFSAVGALEAKGGQA